MIYDKVMINWNSRYIFPLTNTDFDAFIKLFRYISPFKPEHCFPLILYVRGNIPMGGAV